MRTVCTLLALALLAGSPVAAGEGAEPPAGDPKYLGADLDLLLQWFPGRFDNNQQVKEDEDAEVEKPMSRLHSIFKKVDLPEIGKHTFYVEQYGGTDPTNIYRQRLYVWTANKEENAIQLSILRFPDEKAVVGAHEDPSKLAGLTEETMVPTPAGCEVYWRRVDDHFVGYMKEKACVITSRRGPRAGDQFYITDTLYLDDDEIRIHDQAFWLDDDSMLFGSDRPHKLKKAREFSCWAAVADDKENPPGPKEKEGWTGYFGLNLHDQGGVAVLAPKGEQKAEYVVELAQRTFKNERKYVDILKLGIKEPDTERDLRYIWAEPESKNIGMNLRWIQVGCTKK